MEFLAQIIATAMLYLLYFLTIAVSFVLGLVVFAVKLWPVTLFLGIVLAIVLFTIYGKKAGADN